MNKSLFSIIKKNFKILWRSKFSTIAIILAPFLIILLAGYAFDSSGVSGIVIGSYSNSYTSLTNEVLEDFSNQNFAVNRYSSQEDCLESVKLSKTQMCILFPSDLSETGSSEEISFYVDNSRINLAYKLINDIEGKISEKGSSLGVNLAEKIVLVLISAKDSLPQQNTLIKNSQTKINNINDLSNSAISLENIDSAITSLNEAKDLANNSELKTKISNSINDLQSLRNSTILLSGNLEKIDSYSNEVSSSLSEISANLETIISSINDAEVLEAENIVSPLKTKIESVNSSSNNRTYLIPTILALLALFGGILLSSTFVLKERKTKAYFRNFVTPTKDFTFFLGNYLTCLIILVLQFSLVFVGIEWILGMTFSGILVETIVILLLSLTTFILIGTFIGYLFKSEETTIFSGVIIAALMMFFSNTILPVETISSGFKKLAMFNPLVIVDSTLKKIMLFNLTYPSFLIEIYYLAGFIVLFAVLSFIGIKITKRML